MVKDTNFVLWIDKVDKEDIPQVGGKGANLGEMAKMGIPVPQAFIVTAQAYFYFLDEGGLRPKIKNYLSQVNFGDPDSVEQASANIRRAILATPIPKEISQDIIKSYLKLGSFLREALVAIRSSATAEDLPTASFAGQQETFLNVAGEAAVVDKVRRCWASLWLARAIFYRQENNFDHFKVGIAVPVQKMIQSENSGVIFTLDPLTNEKGKIVIEAIYGLGEMIVQGEVIPDRYEVNKKNLTIIKKEISGQDKMLVKKGLQNLQVDVPKSLSQEQKINDEEIIKLAEIALKIEKHYFFPQDIEWALEKGEIYIVQTRPVTTIKKTDESNAEVAKLSNTRTSSSVLTGVGASPGIASGPVKNIRSAKEIGLVMKGDILVTEMTNPDFVPAMKKAVAIVTDKGGRTAHAAIVSRELGIPCVVGAKTATQIFKSGQVITVNGATGEIFRGGKVSGTSHKASGKKETEKLSSKPSIPTSIKTATKIYINLAEPEKVKEMAKLPVDGVGLLRAEFMMAQIGVHPKKIIHDKKQTMFIDKLADNLKVFCEAFNPRPVVYRTTDFKTNEYRNLKGGEDFEPEEANPMLGYRGAFRYRADPAVFELELQAVKKIREQGFKNLWLMIPFVRTPLELIEVKKIVASVSLVRGPTFKIWLMVEIPANVILLEKFIEAGIDGVSIGSNDLTMLILGVDRDNAEVAQDFNEQDPAVLWALEKTVKTCQKFGLTSSICGQAPSDYPGLVDKLVSWGITSVSINPDALERTREVVYETERRLCQK